MSKISDTRQRDPAKLAAIAELRREGDEARRNLLDRRPAPVRDGGTFRQRSDEEIANAGRRAEEQRKAAKKLDAIRGRNLPPGYAKASLEDVSALPVDVVDPYSRAIDAMHKILNRPKDAPMIVAMIGKIGGGKTHLACALINAMAQQARTARYTTAFDYILAVRKTFSREISRDQTDVENEHIHPELLVLDEMQVRGETESEEILLLRLIDKRYQHNRATLLLSNHADKDEFKARIDARIWDRMKQNGGVFVVKWDSIRGRVKAAT